MANHGWIWVKLPDHITKQILEFGRSINKDELYDKDGEFGVEDRPHITLKYGLIDADSDIVKECLSDHSGGVVKMGSSSIFEAKDYDVLKITCFGDDLRRLHDKINSLPHEDNFMKYKPHATIAYLKKGEGKKYVGKFSIDEEFSFNKVYFKYPDGERSVLINLKNIKQSSTVGIKKFNGFNRFRKNVFAASNNSFSVMGFIANTLASSLLYDVPKEKYAMMISKLIDLKNQVDAGELQNGSVGSQILQYMKKDVEKMVGSPYNQEQTYNDARTKLIEIMNTIKSSSPFMAFFKIMGGDNVSDQSEEVEIVALWSKVRKGDWDFNEIRKVTDKWRDKNHLRLSGIASEEFLQEWNDQETDFDSDIEQTAGAKPSKEYLNKDERQQVKDRFGDDVGCSFAKDKDGYYCYTHRSRSDSYPSIKKIPKSKVEFVEGTA